MSNPNDDEIPRGPEDIPLKNYVSKHPIVILVTDVKSDRIIREERVDYSSSEARKWIGRISFWGTTHGYSITTMSEKDHEEWSRRLQDKELSKQ